MRHITCLVIVLVSLTAHPGGAQIRPAMKFRYYPSHGSIQLKVQGEMNPGLLRTPEGKNGLTGHYFANPDLEGDPVFVRTAPRVDFDWDGSPGNGLPADEFSIRWTGRLGPVPQDGVYEIAPLHDDGVRVWVGGERVFSDWGAYGARFEPKTVRLEAGKLYELRIDFVDRTGPAHIRFKWLMEEGEVPGGDGGMLALKRQDGQSVLERRLEGTIPGSMHEVQTDDLAGGLYSLVLRTDWSEGAAERQLRRKLFPWEGNRLGITDKVYPPFKPVKVEGDAVHVVMRRYRQRGLGLWESVKARTNDGEFGELLAGPISLVLNGGQRLEGKGDLQETGPQRAVYRGAASHPAVTVRTVCTTEYDGCMKVELELRPGTEGEELDSLALEIPLRDEMTPLWHVVRTQPIRHNPAGKTPAGKGRVWDSRDFDFKSRGMAGTPLWPGNFKPYIWLGGEERGLAWFANNEKGWVMDWENEPACLVIEREANVVTLRVQLVQKPITIEAPRRIVFGLMASPAKPMPAGWRGIGRPENPRIQFSMGHVFGLSTTYSSKYPLNKDMAVFNFAQAARLGCPVDKAGFLRWWSRRHLTYEMGEKALKRFRGLMPHGLGRSRSSGKNQFTVYFEEFHYTSIYHEEVPTFYSEWTGDWMRRDWPGPHQGKPDWFRSVPTGALVLSYQDFACWFGAEWLRRGIGLYFDNSMPKRVYNTIGTSAYRRPDGRIQPSAGIWAHREYLRRIWVLHQQLRNPVTPQTMMLHMTNSHVLPYMVWNHCNLDLEWKYGPGLFQKKFSPDLLRAQSLGLQTGNVPLALASIRGKSSKELKKRAGRTRWAGLLVHEIKGGISSRKYPEPLVDFGYGQEDCEVHNYWDSNAPMKVSDPQCKWLLLRHGGELFVLFCTWNPEDSRVEIELDFGTPGVVVERARNVEAGDIMKVEGGRFSFLMPAYGVRMFRLQ
jgi:hypothetical protein